MLKFEVGKTYTTRSIGDANCIITVEVIGRTIQTIKARIDGRNIKTLRVKPNHDGTAESVKPWGSYSMAPTVDASKGTLT